LPTDTERRLEQLENLLLFGGGVTAGTASGRQLATQLARGTARQAAGVAGRVARPIAMSPLGRATILGNLADQVAMMAEEAYLEEQGIDPGLAFEGIRAGGPILPLQREQMVASAIMRKATKRKVSKANKAVKHAMSLLKAGSKRSTGADKGKLVKGAFKIATKAAGLANPLTPSNIGKGKGKVKALARKIRKWW